jgi:hypothetical protein
MTAIPNIQPQANSIGQTALGFVLGIILSAFSDVMLLLSFPPYGIWSLAVSFYLLCWLTPYLARDFGTESGLFFTYLGVLIAEPRSIPFYRA